MKTVDHVCSAFLRQILLRMKELGLSQTDLAKRMKVSRPYITKVLRQDVNFSRVSGLAEGNGAREGHLCFSETVPKD